jgi:hypothetical protein
LDNFNCLNFKLTILIPAQICHWITWVNFYTSNCTFQLQNFYSTSSDNFYVLMPYFFIYCLMISFSFLFVVSFTSLNILRAEDLISCTNNSNV